VTAPELDRVIGPTCGCDRATARLELRLRKSDRVDVSMVDAAGEPVRRLATDLRRPPGPVRFRWDGRDDGGEVVPNGRYRLRIRLHEARRTITVPTAVRVDSTPPRIALLSARPQVISPDGDGHGDRVQYVYRVNELALPWVLVDGADTVRGQLHPAGRGRIRWRGRRGGDPVPVGAYETSLVAEDEAGNRSEATRTIPVRVRYVELLGVPSAVSRRARGPLVFTIDSDTKDVEWRLTRIRGGSAGSSGRAEPGPVSVPLARLAPGRYILEARANVHTDRALVRVTR
jgi:hypothetical protein